MRTTGTRHGPHAHAVILEDVVDGAHRYTVRVTWTADARVITIDGIVGQFVALKIAGRLAETAGPEAAMPVLLGVDDRISRPGAAGASIAQIQEIASGEIEEGADPAVGPAPLGGPSCSKPSLVSSQNPSFFLEISRPDALPQGGQTQSVRPSKTALRHH